MMMREIVEQLTNGIIAGPDDLVGIGECINLIEKLEDEAFELPQASIETINRIKELFRLVILEDCEDLEHDWNEIQRLIGSLGCQCRGEPSPSESGPILEEIAAPMPSATIADEADEQEEPAAAEEQEECDPVEFQDPELLKDFIEEAKEHLSSIELNMITLETNPGDVGVINDIFRPFHSIKGVAGFLNLKQIHELSHEVENYLDQARSGKLNITDAAIDVVLAAVDILKSLLMDLESPPGSVPGTQPSQIKELLERVKGFTKGNLNLIPVFPLRSLGKSWLKRALLKPTLWKRSSSRVAQAEASWVNSWSRKGWWSPARSGKPFVNRGR